MKISIIAPIFLYFQLQYVTAVIDLHQGAYWDYFEPCNYDYTNEDYVEVLYLPPEKIKNIIDFLNKFTSTPGPRITQVTRRTTEGTTTLPSKIPEETTTTTEMTTTTSTQSITTFKEDVDEKVEDPVEDVVNREPVEIEEVSTGETIIEIPVEPTLGELDNEDDDDFDRDSEEKAISVKTTEKIEETTTSVDENDSKPKDVNRWFGF